MTCLHRPRENYCPYDGCRTKSEKEEGYRNGEKLAREHYQNLIQEAEDLKRSSEEMVRNTVMNPGMRNR